MGNRGGRPPAPPSRVANMIGRGMPCNERTWQPPTIMDTSESETMLLEPQGRGCIGREERRGGGGVRRGVWHKASALGCLPLAVPIGLLPLLIVTLCGSERVLVVSTEPLDDLSCLTTPGVGCPGDGLLPVPLTRCIQMHTRSPCGGLPTPALTRSRGGGRGLAGAPLLLWSPLPRRQRRWKLF